MILTVRDLFDMSMCQVVHRALITPHHQIWPARAAPAQEVGESRLEFSDNTAPTGLLSDATQCCHCKWRTVQHGDTISNAPDVRLR